LKLERCTVGTPNAEGSIAVTVYLLGTKAYSLGAASKDCNVSVNLLGNPTGDDLVLEFFPFVLCERTVEDQAVEVACVCAIKFVFQFLRNGRGIS